MCNTHEAPGVCQVGRLAGVGTRGLAGWGMATFAGCDAGPSVPGREGPLRLRVFWSGAGGQCAAGGRAGGHGGGGLGPGGADADGHRGAGEGGQQ
jgi:hypothetical protein